MYSIKKMAVRGQEKEGAQEPGGVKRMDSTKAPNIRRMESNSNNTNNNTMKVGYEVECVCERVTLNFASGDGGHSVACWML